MIEFETTVSFEKSEVLKKFNNTELLEFLKETRRIDFADLLTDSELKREYEYRDLDDGDIKPEKLKNASTNDLEDELKSRGVTIVDLYEEAAKNLAHRINRGLATTTEMHRFIEIISGVLVCSPQK